MNEWIIGALYVVVLLSMPLLALATIMVQASGDRDVALVLGVVTVALSTAWVAGVIAVAVTA